jgi:hypothetical protein
VGSGEHAPCPGFSLWPVDDDGHLLALSDLAHDLAVDPFDGGKLARPVGTTMGPAQPGGLMGLPFGGHREAKLGGLLEARDLHRLLL